MPEDKLPSVQQHAATTIASLIANDPDKGAAAAALAVPAFSSGTRAISETTGQPIDPPPPFTEGQVAIPKGTDGPAQAPGTEPAGAAKTPEELLAEHRARLTGAQAAPAAAAAQAAPAAQAPGAEAAAAAVEAAVEDIWGDAEDFEFEDPDFDGVKIPIRVPKKYAETAKRGYGRRAALDRTIRYLGESRGVLEPLIADGRIQRILPLITRALEDKAYGDHVWTSYQRAIAGLPLAEQARIEAAAAGTVAAAPPNPVGPEGLDLSEIDPLFAPSLQPVLQRLSAAEQRLRDVDTQRTQEAQRQQQMAAQQQASNEQLRLGHQDLARMMPTDYSGNLASDQQRWNRTFNFAKENGYFDAYGLRAGVLFAGQYLAQMDAERLALTASPAATALQRIEASQIDAAGREAAASARTVAGGGIVSPPPPPVAAGPIPTIDPKTGKPRPAADYLRDVQRQLAAAG